MADDRSEREDRADEFPFEEWQRVVENCVGRLTGRVRNSAKHAFEHLRKAWRLHHLDDEMSLFRALTAEEESSTALMYALKARGYPGADRLQPWNHQHKNAFWPLILAINRVLIETQMPFPHVTISKEGDPRAELHIDLAQLTGKATKMWASPDPPLHFLIRDGNASAQTVHLFEKQLTDLADENGAQSVRSYVKSVANLRNRLLYASHDGAPHVQFPDSVLIERAVRVGVLSVITIMVMQSQEHQLFIMQCLNSILPAIDKSKTTTTFDYSAGDIEDRPRILVHRLDGQLTTVAVRRPLRGTLRWGNGRDDGTHLFMRARCTGCQFELE